MFIKADNKWYNIVKGKLTVGPSVAQNKDNKKWFYVDKNGVVDFGFEGIAPNAYGKWYVKAGKVDFGTTNLVFIKKDNKWYNVVKGKLTVGPILAQNKDNKKWFYVDEKGTVDFSYEGIAANEYGRWYVKAGKVDFSRTGLFENKHDNKTYNLVAGRVTAGPNMVRNNAGLWYINEQGIVDFSKNDRFRMKQFYITARNGEVICVELPNSYNIPWKGKEHDSSIIHAIAINILTGKNYDPEYISKNMYKDSFLREHISPWVYNEDGTLTEKQMCDYMYKELIAGKPVFMEYVIGNEQYYVLVNGVKHVENINNLHYSDFYCLDTHYGCQKTVTDAWNFRKNNAVAVKAYK